jgi:hypothetical protein
VCNKSGLPYPPKFRRNAIQGACSLTLMDALEKPECLKRAGENSYCSTPYFVVNQHLQGAGPFRMSQVWWRQASPRNVRFQPWRGARACHNCSSKQLRTRNRLEPRRIECATVTDLDDPSRHNCILAAVCRLLCSRSCTRPTTKNNDTLSPSSMLSHDELVMHATSWDGSDRSARPFSRRIVPVSKADSLGGSCRVCQAPAAQVADLNGH